MIVVMTEMIYCSNSVIEENTYTRLTALNENFKLAPKGIPFVISAPQDLLGFSRVGKWTKSSVGYCINALK